MSGPAQAGAAHPLLEFARANAARRGRDLGRRAVDAGLAVTGADGATRPIPIAALPIILDGDEIARRHRLAQQLVSATMKAGRWRLAGPRAAEVLAALSPAEQRLLVATGTRQRVLAVARVDFLGVPPLQALEVNATIPAMQGYSDIAAASWIRTFGANHPQCEALIAANGSNTLALLQALQQIHAAHRDDRLARIGLLCRRGDSQFTELRHVEQRFRGAGVDARIVHPDELVFRHGFLEHDGAPLPLVYRHLFLHRLDRDPAPALEAAIAAEGARGTLVLNGPAPHLEMKSTLALLSESASDDGLAMQLALSEEERAAIAAAVPWTRCFGPPRWSAATDRLELLDRVAGDPDTFVLKRNWSYGGHEVFVGRAHRLPGFLRRAQALYPGLETWPELCRRAFADTRGGGFVVQRAVDVPRVAQILCTPESVESTEVVSDYAAFASVGATVEWGGVSRAASEAVVNIAGGGALVPILRREIADRMASTAQP